MLRVLILIILVSTNAFSADRLTDREVVKLLKYSIKKKYYLASLPLLKRILVSTTTTIQGIDKIIEQVYPFTGAEHFAQLPKDILSKSKTSYFKYLLAKRYFEKGNNLMAINSLRNIRDGHPISAKAFQLAGIIHLQNDSLEKAEVNFKKCIKVNKRSLKKELIKSINLKQYRELTEVCSLGLARTYYKNKKYSKALDIYEDIPKSSPHFANTSLEKSWIYFKQNKIQKTIGTLLNFRKYNFEFNHLPEIDYLLGLSFSKLCQYDHIKKLNDSFNDTSYNNLVHNFLKKNVYLKNDFFSFMNEKRMYFDNPLYNHKLNNIKNYSFYIKRAYVYKNAVKNLEQIERARDLEAKYLSILYQNTQHELKNIQDFINKYTKITLLNLTAEIKRTAQKLDLIHIDAYRFKRNYKSKLSALDISEAIDDSFWPEDKKCI